VACFPQTGARHEREAEQGIAGARLRRACEVERPAVRARHGRRFPLDGAGQQRLGAHLRRQGNELFGALAEKIERVTTVAHRFIAEDDHVVVQARGANTTRAGAPYNNSYCFVFRIEDGKLKEVTEYMDTELATAVLGDPQPRAAE
jgi:ketosteroid isomerase-like protein